MAITGRPRPLPECSCCEVPLRREVHADQLGKCSDCMTPADRMAAEHRRQHLARIRREGVAATTKRVDSRISRLAAKRQGDAARKAGLVP